MTAAPNQRPAVRGAARAQGDGAPDWLIDYWMPNSNLPPHQHPCGAYYFVVEGELCYEENSAGVMLSRCIGPGELRWVRRAQRLRKRRAP